MNHTIEVTNDHSSYLFMLSLITFCQNYNYICKPEIYCLYRKNPRLLLKFKIQLLYKIFLGNEDRIEVNEKRYINTLAAHV